MATPTKPRSVEKHSAALDAVGTRPWRVQRRPTKQTPYELANHAKAYLEGGQYASGYDFLYSLLGAGTSISTPAQPYIGFLPPPAYIALAASLIVYPPVTTKAKSQDAIKGSDSALRYLQCVHATIDGPAYPTIKHAFTFPEERKRRRAPGHRSAAGSLSPEPGGDMERIMGAAANAQSLWYRAEDFWHIVGWAFNCSVVHKKRWERWKLWLNIMLNLLEADWNACSVQAKQDEGNSEWHLQNSLLWYYTVGDAESATRGMRRRIIKAILATATPESCKEFSEIWNLETAEPKRKKENSQPLGEVNFETGEMGDYDSDEEMQGASEEHEDNGKPKSSPGPLTSNVIQTVDDAVNRLGGHDAIALRQRLVALLERVAEALPTQFTSLSDFFDNLLEDFIQLPTIVFQVLLSTFRTSQSSQIAFQASLLLPLVSGKLPDYFRFDPEQEHFEGTLLALKGTTQSFAANAKISLILEHMFMFMMRQNALKPTRALRKALESGIKARQSVYGTGKGKRGNAKEEDQGKDLMLKSSERLLGLLEVLEVSSGQEPQRVTRNAPRALQRTRQAASRPNLRSSDTGSSLSPAPDSDIESDI